MSPRPKLQRIVDAVATRLESIAMENGYYTNMGLRVLRNQRAPQLEELPCCMVYIGQRTAESQQCEAVRCAMTINVMGYAERIDPSEILGYEILSDIQRAVELEDDTLGGLLRGAFGLAFASEQILLPEVGANAVGATVVYSAPNIRVMGDPELA